MFHLKVKLKRRVKKTLERFIGAVVGLAKVRALASARSDCVGCNMSESVCVIDLRQHNLEPLYRLSEHVEGPLNLNPKLTQVYFDSQFRFQRTIL